MRRASSRAEDSSTAKPIGARIVSGAIWTAAEAWGREVTVFVVFIILARLLGPSAIGLVALAMSAPTILSVPVAKGVPDALVQRKYLEDIHVDSAFWFLLGLGAAISALIWASADLIEAAFDQPGLDELVRWTSLIVIVNAFAAVPSAMLRRRLEFRQFALRTLLGAGVAGIVGLSMALQGFGVWSLVAMNLGRAASEGVFIFWACDWRPRFRFSYAKCAELFGFSASVVAQSLIRMLNDEIPKVVIGAFLSPSAVGIYSLARRPVTLLSSVLITPINRLTLPSVARMQDDPARIQRFFDIGVRLAAMIGFPAFVGFAAVAPMVVPLALGKEWLPAIGAIQIMMLLGLQRCIDALSSHLILALGYTRLLLILHMIYTFLAIVFFTLAAQFSLEATVIAIVACNYALLPIFLYFVGKLAGIDVMQPAGSLLRIGLITAIMYAVVVVAAPPPTDRLATLYAIVLCVAVGLAVYGAGAALLLRRELLIGRDLLRRLRGTDALGKRGGGGAGTCP